MGPSPETLTFDAIVPLEVLGTLDFRSHRGLNRLVIGRSWEAGGVEEGALQDEQHTGVRLTDSSSRLLMGKLVNLMKCANGRTMPEDDNK